MRFRNKNFGTLKNGGLVMAVFLLTLVSYTQNKKMEDLFHAKVYSEAQDSLLLRIFYPKSFDENKKYPVILFLHGSGERGNDNSSQLIHGADFLAQECVMGDFSAILLFPQCPKDDFWSSVQIQENSKNEFRFNFEQERPPKKSLSMVMNYMDSILTKKYIDKNKVYIMGLSMGAMGLYEMLSNRPNMFAAAVPICGGGNLNHTSLYASKVPIWVFHGASDKTVSPHYSIRLVEAIIKHGGSPRFTLYDQVGHDSWNDAFSEEDLLPWMFSKTKN